MRVQIDDGGQAAVQGLRDEHVGRDAEVGSGREEDLLADEMVILAAIEDFGAGRHGWRVVAEGVEEDAAALRAVLLEGAGRACEEGIRVLDLAGEPIDDREQRPRVGIVGCRFPRQVERGPGVGWRSRCGCAARRCRHEGKHLAPVNSLVGHDLYATALHGRREARARRKNRVRPNRVGSKPGQDRNRDQNRVRKTGAKPGRQNRAKPGQNRVKDLKSHLAGGLSCRQLARKPLKLMTFCPDGAAGATPAGHDVKLAFDAVEKLAGPDRLAVQRPLADAFEQRGIA